LGPVEVAVIPLMEISPLVSDLDLSGVSALIFTSAAGIEVYAGLTDDRTLPAWCVGDRTAEAARDIGLQATSAGGDAAALVALMAEARPEGRLLHLHGAHTRGDVAERLVEAGLRAEACALYDQLSVPPGTALAGVLAHDGPIIAPLFSPRSARLFAEAVGPDAPRLQPVALSAAVRDALPDPLARRTPIADGPDAPAMIRAMAALISR
jgi:uroporphyrinogen-III synthase